MTGPAETGIGKLAPRASLSDAAAARLRELILLEQLSPGAPIRERDIAAQLGISRTPLREALRLLEAEGLVEYSPSRRPHVADPSIEVLREGFEVIGGLEALAGELAATRASDAALSAISAMAERMQTRSDAAPLLEFFAHDMGFHRAIVAAAGNESLIRTHGQYNARLWRARFISSRMRTARGQTLQQHADIADALTRRDAPAAATAMRGHIASAVGNVADTLGELRKK